LTCDYNFNAEIWSTLSDEALDFIASLLVLDPQKRRTSEEALSSPWLMGKCSSLDEIPSTKEMQQINYSFLDCRDRISSKICSMTKARKATMTDSVHFSNIFDLYNSSGNVRIELSAVWIGMI